MALLKPIKRQLIKCLQRSTLSKISNSTCIHNEYKTPIAFVNLLIKICTQSRHFAEISTNERLNTSSRLYLKYQTILTEMHCIGFCKECALSFVAYHMDTFIKLISLPKQTPDCNDIESLRLSVQKQCLISMYCDINKSYLFPIQLYFDIIRNLLHHLNIIKYIFKNNILFSPLLSFWKICWNYHNSQNHLQAMWGSFGIPLHRETQCRLSKCILFKLSVSILVSTGYWKFKYDTTRYAVNKYTPIIAKYPWDELHLNPPFVRCGMIRYFANNYHSIYQRLFNHFMDGKVEDIMHNIQDAIFSSNNELSLLLAFLAICTRIYIKSNKYLYGLHHLGFIDNAMEKTYNSLCNEYKNKSAAYVIFSDLMDDIKSMFIIWMNAMSNIQHDELVILFNKWFMKYVKRNILPNMIVCANINCQDSGNEFKKCSRCTIVHYCSRKCQKKHWNRYHRHQCSLLSRI